MLVLLLGLLLAPSSPEAAPDSLDTCLAQAPSSSEPPLVWGGDVQKMWTRRPPISPDSLRSYLSQIRGARRCFLRLDPEAVARPFLGNVMRTYYVETALLAGLRRFSQAHATFEEARTFLAENETTLPSSNAGRTYWTPALHQNQGFLYYLLGNLSASIEHYLKAYETTVPTDPGRRVRFLVDVGILLQRMQDYRSARHYLDRARQLFVESDLSPETHAAKRARLLSVRADLLLEETLKNAYSRDKLRRVRDLARRSLALAQPGTERHARTSSLLSESLGYLGAGEEAYRLNDTVRAYARANDDARLRTLALFKRGLLHVKTDRWTQADSVLHEALARADRLGDLDYQRRILLSLGRLHEMRADWKGAERLYRRGIAVVEQYRESLTASQWSMTAFAQWREVHRGLVRSLLAQERPRDALLALDRSRARHLQDLRTQARVSEQLPPAKRVRLDSLSRALSAVRNQFGTASLSNSGAAALRDREARLMAARQRLLDLDPIADRPGLDAVTRSLAEQDRALVSYFLDDPWPGFDRSPRSVAFVLTPDSLRTVPLPGLTQDSIQSHVEAVSPLFTSRGKPDRANAMHFNLRPLHRLHDAVYAPVAETLPPDRPLTVVPDGPLFHLPFSMLVRSMPGGRFAPAEARFVLHDRPTAMELASSLVADTTGKAHDWTTFDPQMAAYGVSNFDTLRTVPPSLRTAHPGAAPGSTMTLPSLPGVRDELRALQSTVPRARVRLDGQATERRLRRSIRNAGVLHVASHAFVNDASPLQNAILLRPDSREGGTPARPSAGSSDGVLFLHELQGQRAQIPMVVLSGCSTGAGTLRGGEGMEGLQYAFRAMGAQSTVSTLWPVADRASVDLMRSFYHNLQDGDPKDVALREAQLAYLEDHPKKASPFFWAPPVLYGSPASLPLDGPPLAPWVWWSLGVIVVVGIGGGGWVLHRSSADPPVA